jgi:hypothetical protein
MMANRTVSETCTAVWFVLQATYTPVHSENDSLKCLLGTSREEIILIALAV